MRGVTVRGHEWSLLALLVVSFLPVLFRQQLVTGTLVNSTLLLAATLLGTREIFLMCLAPSLSALSTGLLPLPMAPLVPFLFLGNILYVWVFTAVLPRNSFLAVVIAALMKFGFLALLGAQILSLLPGVNPSALVVLGWPQLVTAILGGGITLAALRWGRLL